MAVLFDFRASVEDTEAVRDYRHIFARLITHVRSGAILAECLFDQNSIRNKQSAVAAGLGRELTTLAVHIHTVTVAAVAAIRMKLR